jgi:hypothetical protein
MGKAWLLEEEAEEARRRGDASGVRLPTEEPPPRLWSMWGMETLRPPEPSGPRELEAAVAVAEEGEGPACWACCEEEEEVEAERGRYEAESGEGPWCCEKKGVSGWVVVPWIDSPDLLTELAGARSGL